MLLLLQATAVERLPCDDRMLGTVSLGALALVLEGAWASREERLAPTLLPGVADWGPALAAAAAQLEEQQRQLVLSPVLPAGDLHLLVLLVQMQGARSLSHAELQQAHQPRRQAEAACQQLLALAPANAACLLQAAAHRAAVCVLPETPPLAIYRTALEAAKASKGGALGAGSVPGRSLCKCSSLGLGPTSTPTACLPGCLPGPPIRPPACPPACPPAEFLLASIAARTLAHHMLLGEDGPTWCLPTVTALLADAARFATLCKPWLPRSAWQGMQERLDYTRQGAEQMAAMWPGGTQLPCLTAIDRGQTRALPMVSAAFCKPCTGCGQPSAQLRSCSGCRTAACCSRQCQAQHWKEGGHRRECKRLAAAAAAAAGASSSSG